MVIGYLPMTADLLHIGHIDMIRHCESLCDELYIGLIYNNGIKNYRGKEPIIDYKDRYDMLQNVIGWGTQIVGQECIDPTENLKILEADIMFSGDAFEPEECDAAIQLGIGICNTGRHGDISTTKIKERVIKQNYGRK